MYVHTFITISYGHRNEPLLRTSLRTHRYTVAAIHIKELPTLAQSPALRKVIVNVFVQVFVKAFVMDLVRIGDIHILYMGRFINCLDRQWSPVDWRRLGYINNN